MMLVWTDITRHRKSEVDGEWVVIEQERVMALVRDSGEASVLVPPEMVEVFWG